MPFEDDFLYPLGLLLIGALITGLLIPLALSKLESTQRKIERERENAQKRLDRQREDHKNELEIKSDIVKRISRVDAISGMSIFSLADKLAKKKSKYVNTLQGEEYSEFSQEVSITGALINAYFRDSPVYEEWKSFSHCEDILWIVFDAATEKRPANAGDLKTIRKYLANDIKFDWDRLESGDVTVIHSDDLYEKVNSVLSEKKNSLVIKILNEKINTGKKLPLESEIGTSQETYCHCGNDLPCAIHANQPIHRT